MYIWLVLSTFLAILAGFSLPMRADTTEKVNVPTASAHMMKMVVNHRSTLKHIRKLKWPYYCGGETGVEYCDKTKRIGFSVGIVDYADVEGSDSVPEGFALDVNYKSQIFCYNMDGTPAADCNEADEIAKMKILITYGDLHEKWLSSKTLETTDEDIKPVVSPSDDMISAFRNHFGYDEFVGYVREDDGDIEIVNYQGVGKFEIPEDMWGEMSGSGICNEKYNGSCIAYASVL